MKKIPGWIYVVLVFAILIAVKLLFFGKKEEKGGAAKGGKPSGPILVNYYVTKPLQFTDKVYSSGKIGALNEIEIKSEIAGKVTAIYFKESEQVTKGAPLVKINDADLQAELIKNKTQIKLSEEKTDRLKKLVAINGISQEEYEVQENEVNTLKADQSFILAQLAKTTITAPFTGMVGLRNISEGAYVSPTQVIASLVQVKPLFVEFSVPEKYTSTIKKGMEIEFAHENSDKEFKASIYAIEPKIDELTKTLRCRALYNGPEDFYPGSFVKVYIDMMKEENSLMIPTQCIIPILKGQKVIIAKNGEADEVKVITGVRTEDKIQIMEGLKDGDTVLTTGLLSV
ncbi:MAG TPA: efflux RND transporter periplasmic adaptor subunit, partial [Bacteroidia bacterium]|nr:efflux RND transporter periplasmic adaptor subunit [Bacteroidia bacterium]